MILMTARRILFVGLAFLLGTADLVGQAKVEQFGKNRIQYRDFDWQYLNGENFDVYYYDGRRDIATESLNFLEREIDRITDLIAYPPYFKIKVFLYNSLTDLRQSNVGLNKTNNNGGGETEFIKSHIEIAYVGTAEKFREELLLKISNLMVREMMFGGNLKDIFQSALLMNLPDWFVDGAALYVAKGWSAEMDDFVRQAIRRKKSKNISSFTGPEAALIGQSVWNFMAERFGKSSIGNVLGYTRVTRNEEKGITYSLPNMNFKQFISEWHKYYTEIDEVTRNSYISFSDSARFTGTHREHLRFTQAKLSPDGRYIAYAQNDRGRYAIKVYAFETGREITILSGGSKVINQTVDYAQPILDWADATTLGVIAVNQGKYVFWLYDLNTQSKLPRELERFSNIQSLKFSSNGRLAVLSADLDGQNDLFLASTRRDRIRRLTNDIFDDIDPSFIPGTNRIVFSSNRTTDSVRFEKPVNLTFDELPADFNLFVFDLDSTVYRSERLTNLIGKNHAPIARDNSTFYYLSDQRGISNLFKFSLSSGIHSQVTNFESRIQKYDMNFQTGTFSLIGSEGLVSDIYVYNNFNFNRQMFTPATKRREAQQLKALRERRRDEPPAPVIEEEKTPQQEISVKDLINSRLGDGQPEVRDSVTIEIDSISEIDTTPSDSVTQNDLQDDNVVINTDDYKFDDEVINNNNAANVTPAQNQTTFLNRYTSVTERKRVMGPFPYESKFSADNIITSAVIDPLRGFGIQIETQMNDLLENYRFVGGIMSTLDLRSGDAYAEFQYLPKFIDFNARIERKAIRWEPDINSDIFNYSLLKFEVGASVPLNERTRFSVKPFAAIARSVNQGSVAYPVTPPSVAPTNHSYIGGNVELVYDNSIITGNNIIEGSRGKAAFIHYEGVDDPSLSFSQAYIDLRHYQKIYREIVFAVRGYGGSFFGKSPKQYLLGGMNNWLFNKTRATGRTVEGISNPIGDRSENQDLLFVEYATNLRGFDYSTLFGNNVMLLNAEFRVPLIRALSNNKITSNFFRNLQFTAFYDIGTSWSGSLPFSEDHATVVKVVPEPADPTAPTGPFIIELKEYLNPWLYSYGIGMRTVVLGYYVKADLAWPVQNFQVQPPRVQVTLGFDF